MRLDTEALRALLAVVEHGGMTAAADALGVSQSAVSWRIRRLEDRAGMVLLDRRDLDPTPAGRELLAYAATIVDAHDAAVRHLEGTAIEGTVRVGSSDDQLAERAADILGRFRQAHPHSTIELHVHHSLVLDQMLDSRQLDLAMHYVLEPELRADDLVLGSDELVWVVGEHAAIDAEVVPLVSFGQGAATAQLTVTTLRACGIAYNEVFTGSSFRSVLSAVRAGLGIALIDRASVPDGVVEWGRASELPQPPRVCQVLRRAKGSIAPLADELHRELSTRLGAAQPMGGEQGLPDATASAM